MSLYVLYRPYWHSMEKGLINVLKISLVRNANGASWLKPFSTGRFHLSRLVNRDYGFGNVPLSIPCCCSKLSRVTRHWILFKRHISAQSFRQRHKSAAFMTITDRHRAVVLNSSIIARSLHNAEPTEISLSLDDLDVRDFVLDILKRYNEAQDNVRRGDISEKERKIASSTISDLSSAAAKIQEWLTIQHDMKTVQQVFQDDKDTEMQELADQEVDEYKERLEAIEDEVMQLVSPKDLNDDNDVIIELTAGVGGQEAMLFTADVFNMYQKFASHMKWRFQILGFDTTDLGGVRHASVSVTGHQAYKRFKFEAGVHRVQRIPKTEKSGRVHTSTMTVAVLPQPKQIDIKLESKDLKMETKKASGAGGQHVNTTDSAVRIVHLPTGTVAECQQERSQIKNKQIAMQLLQAKIYSQRLDQQTKVEQTLRKQQVGSSARSEKIRTYNFAQDRITDHRLGASIHGMESFLSGGDMLEDMTDRLVEQQMGETLKLEVEEFKKMRNT